MQQLQSVLGVIALIAFAWAISERRNAIPWRRVAIGLGLTVVLALVLLKFPPLRAVFAAVNDGVDAVAAATCEFILAFQALPLVLVMSVLTTLLFYWRIVGVLSR